MENDILEAYGLHWRVGRPWGLAHPADNCYADAGEVDIRGDLVNLGVGLKPQTFHDRVYPWAVGYISSLESFKYGTFDITFRLPLGLHLQPAIWLSDSQTWPPEIDIVEGWSGHSWLARHTRHCYRRTPLTDCIYPTVHYGVQQDGRHPQLSGGIPRLHCPASWLNIHGINQARLVWLPDQLAVYYNGHRVWHLNDADALAALRDSQGMNIHLNNYVTGSFNYDDYTSMRRRDLTVYDVKHIPL